MLLELQCLVFDAGRLALLAWNANKLKAKPRGTGFGRRVSFVCSVFVVYFWSVFLTLYDVRYIRNLAIFCFIVQQMALHSLQLIQSAQVY